MASRATWTGEINKFIQNTDYRTSQKPVHLENRGRYRRKTLRWVLWWQDVSNGREWNSNILSVDGYSVLYSIKWDKYN
jgi:hypothetical protein